MKNNLVFEKLYQEMGSAAQRKYPNEQLIRFIAGRYSNMPASDRSDCRVLEIGCGSGANLGFLAEEGFCVFGQDISRSGIEISRAKFQKSKNPPTLDIGDFKKLKYQDEYFDSIIDVVSLQHTDLRGHKQAYDEIYRCLKPGGVFFSWHLGSRSISFLQSGGKKIDKLTIEDVRNKNVPFAGCGLTNFLTPTDAEDILSRSGFGNIRIEIFTRSYANMTQIIEYLAIEAEK